MSKSPSEFPSGRYRILAPDRRIHGKVGNLVSSARMGRGFLVVLDCRAQGAGLVEVFDHEIEAAGGNLPVPSTNSPSPASSASSETTTDPDTRDLEAGEGRRFIVLIADLAREFPEELGEEDTARGLPWGWKLYHVPNGGGRTQREGDDLRAQGVRMGVPDYALDLPRFDPNFGRRGQANEAQGRLYAGWRGELKRLLGGDVRPAQHAFLESLRRAGYRAEIWHGADALLRDLRWYLSLSSLSETDFRLALPRKDNPS